MSIEPSAGVQKQSLDTIFHPLDLCSLAQSHTHRLSARSRHNTHRFPRLHAFYQPREPSLPLFPPRSPLLPPSSALLMFLIATSLHAGADRWPNGAARPRLKQGAGVRSIPQRELPLSPHLPQAVCPLLHVSRRCTNVGLNAVDLLLLSLRRDGRGESYFGKACM